MRMPKDPLQKHIISIFHQSKILMLEENYTRSLEGEVDAQRNNHQSD
jgi:hypothetical protein